jgi:hypothetical protein
VKILKSKAVWGLVLAGSALLTGCDNKEEPSAPPPIVIETVGFQVTKPARDAFKRVYPDCEDSLKTPCVTFDEGTWRKVYSYEPYAATKIKKPKRVRGGFVLRF